MTISRKDVDDALLDGFKEGLKARFITIAADPEDTKETSSRLYRAITELQTTYDLAGHVADDIFK